MKKQILNLGKPLSKVEQKKINGGNTYPGPGCYESPQADVDCVSPWIYAPGCGYICMLAPPVRP